MRPSVWLSGMREEDKEFVCGTQFYEDPEPGLGSMWEWVYRNEEPSNLVANPGMITLRQRAFRYWNCSRLQVTGLLGDMEVLEPRSTGNSELDEYKTRNI
ncbi:hypothetical protein HD806DRAFT_551993 [Xylariaceae sp. AK1471]|nr:hypothetical protein HD806DRAFT_551993 [Xylariaceae sp. AK1471]